jgi:hypothetical protein
VTRDLFAIMSIHSILLVIPEADDPRDADRDSVLDFANSKIKLVKRAEKLAHNCFILHGDDGYRAFCLIVGRAESLKVPHRSLFLEEEPKWFPSPPAKII